MQQIKADLMEKKNMTAAQASNMIYSGGLQIHTTMDASMQETAEAAMKNDNMFPAGDGKMDVTYLISVLDTQNPDESSRIMKRKQPLPRRRRQMPLLHP